MYQYDDPSCVASLPAPAAAGTPGYFTDGNPVSGQAPTILTADYMNSLMLELLNVVKAAGITPGKTVYDQLLSAIRRIGQNTVVLADVGTANAYAAVNGTPLVAATWVDGVVQAVKIAHTNTGASTYAPDGLAAIPVYGLKPVGGIRRGTRIRGPRRMPPTGLRLFRCMASVCSRCKAVSCGQAGRRFSCARRSRA